MAASGKPFVTVVSGLPRSGTSMMMRMLDVGGIPALTDDLRQADEDNPRGYYEFEPVKQTKQDSSWVANAVGKVVKMVHLLLLDLPDDQQYRVLFMRRNLDEVVASQDVMLERKGKQGVGLPKDKMIAMFERQIAQVHDHMNSRENFHFVDISYNNVLADPVPIVHQINEFLGGELNTQAMIEVVEPGLYRQRRGSGD
jgi:hypothetical protein